MHCCSNLCGSCWYIKYKLPYDPAVLFLDIYWKEFLRTRVQIKNLDVHDRTVHCRKKVNTTQMSIKWWMDKKISFINTMKYCSSIKRNEVLLCVTTWMNFGNILSERSQTQQIAYCMILFMWNTQNRDKKQINGC